MADDGLDGTLVTYRGGSMRGTFSDGDLLRVVPLGRRGAVAGDVIVFRDAGGATVVHRVRACARDGSLITQGDAHASVDDLAVAPAQLIGRVVAVVHRRQPGMRPRGRLARLVGQLYRGAAGQPWLRRWLRTTLRLDLRQLHFADGKITVVHRGRTVAWLYPQLGRMRSHPPYALVIDPPPAPPRDE
jgi:hypothetical protein